jgi:hypothetical protein
MHALGLLLSTIGVAFYCPVVETLGNRPETWKSGGVMYAQVKAVDKSSPYLFGVHLKPMASLTGAIDPAAVDEIFAPVEIGPPLTSQIDKIPPAGAKVLVYVDGANPNNLRIPKGIVDFMPKGAAIVEVHDFDDPMVSQTIERLRKLRTAQLAGNPRVLDTMTYMKDKWAEAVREAANRENARQKADNQHDGR